MVFFGGFLELLDLFLDVAGHLVEGLREIADFGGAADGRALVEIATADGARGICQAADWRADTDCKEIAEEQSDHGGDRDESKCLRIKFGDPGIFPGLLQTPLA